jgi:hypothetical protein
VTSEGICFVDEESPSAGGQWVVRFLAFEHCRAIEVARLRHPPLDGPAVSVSSDGQWMLSSQSQGGSELSLVENCQ